MAKQILTKHTPYYMMYKYEHDPSTPFRVIVSVIESMKRYQVYLNPHSVSLLDEFGKDVSIARSKIIRLAIDCVAQNLIKIFVATKTPPKDKYILDSLVGAIKLKGKKKTNFAQNIDEIYLSD